MADGLTTQQIKAAPPRAVFIACELSHVNYVKKLAYHLRRDDIDVIAPDELIGWNRYSRFVIDHHARLTLMQACIVQVYSS